MNKRELIERLERLFGYGSRDYIERNEVLDLVKQLDEPKPVKVKQFVAEIIEYYKGQNATLYDALREKNFNKQYNEWLMNEQDAYNKVARAWLDGYTIEEEKRYRVKIKGTGQYLRKDENSIRFSSLFISDFTKDAIEDLGFGEVFNSPLFEIEEVKG